jgi:ubiquinol-cytochrome c reductase cytochrome c1 subunit
MIKSLQALALAVFASGALAAGGGNLNLDHANIDSANKASLQRGAQLYVNYCQGCHSLKYQRYGRIADDLDMSRELVEKNMLFVTGSKVGDTMEIAMPERHAKDWFGQTPPDLSLITREKGVDFVYTYLTTFYLDETRDTGVNNAVFPAASMPWIMWKLEGWKKAVWETQKDHEHLDENGNPKEKEVIVGYEQVVEGELSPEEFKDAMRDLTNFLDYTAEPIRSYRQSLGVKVIFYLLILLVLSYFLKKEIWRDVK